MLKGATTGNLAFICVIRVDKDLGIIPLTAVSHPLVTLTRINKLLAVTLIPVINGFPSIDAPDGTSINALSFTSSLSTQNIAPLARLTLGSCKCFVASVIVNNDM